VKLSEVACGIMVEEEHVEHVFGLMGDGNMALITYLSGQLGIPFHSARHEAGGIGMADGYSRATGKVGVCTVTQGPGLTNAITTLVSARKARTPLVLLAGDVGAAQAGWPQDIDHRALLEAAGIPMISASDPRTIVDDVRSAFRMARERSAPVAMNFPLDDQKREWDAWNVDLDRPEEAAPARLAADAAAVAQAGELLMHARQPLIIAGRGALRSGSGPALRRLGAHVGALLATTLPAKGLFEGDPFQIGIAGSLGTNMATALIGRADVVLAVGASLNDFTTMKRSLFREGTIVIRADLVVSPGPNRYGANHLLEGDATTVSEQLLAAAVTVAGPRTGFRTEEIRVQLRDFRHTDEFADRSEPDAMDPRTLVLALDELLPKERQVVTDVGHFFGFPCTYLSGTVEGRFLPVVDFGAVGAGIGVAIGAAIARPDLTTVFFVGDGGLLMSLPDLDTAARTKSRMVIVVMNDGAYGSELHMLRKWKLSTDAAEFENPSFESIGKAFGLRSVTVRSIAELKARRDELSPTDGPLLIDCRVTQKVLAGWLEGAFER
jgi:thiamine pyrophosphate-dependent acetolactate synthase large subunit-like protein